MAGVAVKNLLYAIAIAVQREERSGSEPANIVRWTITFLLAYCKEHRIPREHFRSMVEEAMKS